VFINNISLRGWPYLRCGTHFCSFNRVHKNYMQLTNKIKAPSFILLRSNKMQQYVGIYLLQNYSTCFGCPSHLPPA